MDQIDFYARRGFSDNGGINLMFAASKILKINALEIDMAGASLDTSIR